MHSYSTTSSFLCILAMLITLTMTAPVAEADISMLHIRDIDALIESPTDTSPDVYV